ncbi:hypothetical protein F7P08_07000 [Klebsiella pneumoniae]|nr:hypothetical protein F7P08_07000 [Klebsiella pneumoniae]
MLRYGAAFFKDPQQAKAPHPPPGAEGAVVKQRQQQRPGQGFTGGDEQIAVVELLLEAGALGFHTRQHPLGCLVEGLIIALVEIRLAQQQHRFAVHQKQSAWLTIADNRHDPQRLANIIFGEGAQGAAGAQNALFGRGLAKGDLQHDDRLVENRDRACLLARGWLLSRLGGQRRLEHQQRQRPEDNDAHPVH